MNNESQIITYEYFYNDIVSIGHLKKVVDKWNFKNKEFDALQIAVICKNVEVPLFSDYNDIIKEIGFLLREKKIK